MKIPSSDIIKISDELSVVVDREAEIKVGDKVAHDYGISTVTEDAIEFYKERNHPKVIYSLYSPLDGVPMLVEQETDEVTKLLTEKQGNADVDWWIEFKFLPFYRAARSKVTFTEEQMRKAFRAGQFYENANSDKGNPKAPFFDEDDLFHSLTHPAIKEIEIEMMNDMGYCTESECYNGGCKYPPDCNTIKAKFIYQ